MKRVFWVAAGVAVGWIIMSWLGLPARQIIFAVVLVTGLFLLALQWRWRERVSLSSGNGVGVNELLEKDSLPPEEAREWLDRFLVEQQDKK